MGSKNDEKRAQNAFFDSARRPARVPEHTRPSQTPIFVLTPPNIPLRWATQGGWPGSPKRVKNGPKRAKNGLRNCCTGPGPAHTGPNPLGSERGARMAPRGTQRTPTKACCCRSCPLLGHRGPHQARAASKPKKWPYLGLDNPKYNPEDSFFRGQCNPTQKN